VYLYLIQLLLFYKETGIPSQSINDRENKLRLIGSRRFPDRTEYFFIVKNTFIKGFLGPQINIYFLCKIKIDRGVDCKNDRKKMSVRNKR
jgi:hypothetical protein